MYCTGLHLKPGNSTPNCMPCVCPASIISTSGYFTLTSASQWLGSWLSKILNGIFSVPLYASLIFPYFGKLPFALQFSIPMSANFWLFFSNITCSFINNFQPSSACTDLSLSRFAAFSSRVVQRA